MTDTDMNSDTIFFGTSDKHISEYLGYGFGLGHDFGHACTLISVRRFEFSKMTSWNQNNLKVEKRHEIEFLKCVKLQIRCSLRIYDKSIDRKLGYNLVF